LAITVCFAWSLIEHGFEVDEFNSGPLFRGNEPRIHVEVKRQIVTTTSPEHWMC